SYRYCWRWKKKSKQYRNNSGTMKGWITDILADYHHNTIVLWIKRDDGAIRCITEPYRPPVYIAGPRHTLQTIKQRMQYDARVHSIVYERKKPWLRQPPEWMLAIRMDDYGAIHSLAEDLSPQYEDCELFNVDVSPVLSFLAVTRLFPLARIDLRCLGLCDRQEALYYQLPELTSVRLGADIEDKHIQALTLDGHHLKGDEEAMLQQLHQQIREQDPDIIFTTGGDSILPLLYDTAHRYHLDFSLRRRPETRSFTGERVFHSYGRVLYRPPQCLLNGRLHIDTENSFFYRQSGLPGLFDISRLSRLPPQKLSRVTPGTAITAMQICYALQRNVVIPWRKNMPERMKTARVLFLADRGGMTYSPDVGFHEHVYEIDFTSMYPCIMINYNISPETLFCDCCQESGHRVPELGYHICTQEQGLIPQVLIPLVRRRIIYKQRLRKTDDPVLVGPKDALKWVLVTCFGYTGYRNAKFGRIECHEAINAYARELLLTASHIAEQHGFHILHGIVDSLWLQGHGNIHQVCHEIQQETGIPIELEGRYKWIMFLPNRSDGAGSLTHYYGAFYDGSMKVRGLELRRSDTPPIVKDCQRDILDHLAKADTKQEFVQLLDGAFNILHRYIHQVQEQQCSIEDLVISKRVTRLPDEYQQRNATASCLQQLAQAGETVLPGQHVSYVIQDASSSRWYRKVEPWQQCSSQTQYDHEKYVGLLCRAMASLLLPFGYTTEKVKQQISGLSTL
ncbi:MAG: type B DNA-directed DNA polymerase, partial [Thermoplasmatota archaeon]